MSAVHSGSLVITDPRYGAWFSLFSAEWGLWEFYHNCIPIVNFWWLAQLTDDGSGGGSGDGSSLV